ncbi:uncharacterized protein LOC143783345 [Ranitomeya variabilis]|uniref:uncharacterized protein LOC143783345 n=1 Tax=Ranitomeya variabilis TaxID=490064 RepID=UPI004056F713
MIYKASLLWIFCNYFFHLCSSCFLRMDLLSSLILLGSMVLTLGCDPEPRGLNIARNGIASQVSVQQPRKMGNAKNAIDGIKDVHYDNGSCILTTKKYNPWWKVDLIQTYKIWNVVLTNRMDCCPERLMGAEVRIGKSPNNNNPVCGRVTNITSATLSFCCNGMEGWFVSVVIPGRSENLSVCEVEVYGDLVSTPTGSNIVKYGEASQVSVYPHKIMGYAIKAIDGGKHTNFYNGSCTLTNRAKNPWWKLNLKQTYKISNVILTNRMDSYERRLLGAEVRIGNSPDNKNPMCGRVTNVTSATLSFYCNGMEGQYISVVIPGCSEYLTLCEVEVYGDLVCTPTGPNIAKYGQASQVSVFRHKIMGYAIKAIDGGKATSFYSGTCTYTNLAKDPWWKLDLKHTYKISNVILTNRMDCCKRRLLGAEVRIGNSPNNNNPVCGTVTNDTFDTFSFCCKGMEGRYVSVVIPGRYEYLSLCEVEVYGDLVCTPTGPNIAKYGEASQVSVYPHKIMGYAIKAIDGGKDTNFFNGSCTHTKLVKDPWWKLDLKQTYKISNVILTNRMDSYEKRLLGAEVRIGNSPDNNNPVCGTVTNDTSATLSFCCNGMEGRYVSVVIPGRSEYLALCEVEVYGDLVCTPTGSNIAKYGEASQVSVYPHKIMGYAIKAIDGGKDTNFYNGSCTLTNLAKDPWWKLDFKQTYKISNVILTNRMDSHEKRLLGAEVRIGNSPDNNNPICGTVTNVTSATLSFCCNGMEGRYVSVVIPGRSEYLALCEVEVYGDLVCTPTGLNFVLK